jgi:hypothetical protein
MTIDPILVRGVDRLLIDGLAFGFAFLGYKLYMNGITKGKGEMRAKSKLGELMLSGTGPGLFFMAFGAIVLIVCLVTGGGQTSETTEYPRIATEIGGGEAETRSSMPSTKPSVQYAHPTQGPDTTILLELTDGDIRLPFALLSRVSPEESTRVPAVKRVRLRKLGLDTGLPIDTAEKSKAAGWLRTLLETGFEIEELTPSGTTTQPASAIRNTKS